MAKRLLLIAFISLFLKLQAQPVIYSIQAHQDDWQLFMSSKIVTDLNAGSKVVFITLTAGDGACGNCPYTFSRENGSVYSSKFLADLTTGSTPTDVPTATIAPVNGHNITRYAYKNTVNYFLRLPDGGINGAGFPSTGSQSLQRLKQNNITIMTPVDAIAGPSTNYSWANLVATIKAIIYAEKISGHQGLIYEPSLDTTSANINSYNKSDHSDHYYSAVAAKEAVAAAPEAWVGIYYFVDYWSWQLTPNLTPDAYENATIMFGLETLAIASDQYRNEFTQDHQQWLPMDYFLKFRDPSGFAP